MVRLGHRHHQLPCCTNILPGPPDGGWPGAYEAAVDAGGENQPLKKLHRFRGWLALSDTEDDLRTSSKQIRDKMLFELREIEKRSGKLKELLEENRSRRD